MVDPTIVANTVTQLTTEQISWMIQERILGLFFSMGLTLLGGILGAKIRDEIGKIIGGFFAIIGGIGTIGFTISLLNLSTQMMP
jgi:hypothetical protein